MNTTKKRIGKKTGISLFTVAMLIMAAVIVFYQNPLEVVHIQGCMHKDVRD